MGNYELGRQAYLNKNAVEAIKCLEAAQKEECPKPSINLMLGICYCRLRNYAIGYRYLTAAERNKEKMKHQDESDKDVIDQDLVAMARQKVEETPARWRMRMKAFAENPQDSRWWFHGIVGDSKVIYDLRREAESIAPTDSTVLLLGAFGSGKDIAARTIHALSRRNGAVLVALNCGELEPQLADSELFGVVPNYPGFHCAMGKRGAFEVANLGTLFLDEIGHLRSEIQAKLLRAIENREVKRIGAEQPQPVDVRLITATVDTKAASGKSLFDGAFLSRIAVNVVPIYPLRYHIEDIPLLLCHLNGTLADRLGRQFKDIEDEAIAGFSRHDWPWNVRELRNVLEHAIPRMENDAVIRVKNLPSTMQTCPC